MERREGSRGYEAVFAALDRFRAATSSGPERSLIDMASGVEDSPRRREESIQRAERELGLDRAFAALVYDTASEERLVPGFAFELVRCGVGVCALEESPGDETTIEGPPDWLSSEPRTAPPPERERRMRASFRRLRGHLEQSDTPEAAIEAFVAEPDVGECRY
jgi:hypothetical protein